MICNAQPRGLTVNTKECAITYTKGAYRVEPVRILYDRQLAPSAIPLHILHKIVPLSCSAKLFFRRPRDPWNDR